MRTILPRHVGAALACLGALVLSACGGGGPAAKIGELEVDRYVALGDGYASSPYSGDTLPAKGCLRSEASYPALLAEKVEADEFVDVTCAFARTQDLSRATEPVRGRKGPVGPQLAHVDESTDLVTLTIGMSDRDFNRRLFDVCADPCEEGIPVGELGNDLQRISAAVHRAIEDITERAPEARVVVVGYPTLLPAEGGCEDSPELGQKEVDLVNAVLHQLGTVLRSAARRSGADYLDVADLSQGHDMCADDPWVQGDVNKRGEAPRFHPLAPLNEAIATRLADMLEP